MYFVSAKLVFPQTRPSRDNVTFLSLLYCFSFFRQICGITNYYCYYIVGAHRAQTRDANTLYI